MLCPWPGQGHESGTEEVLNQCQCHSPSLLSRGLVRLPGVWPQETRIELSPSPGPMPGEIGRQTGKAPKPNGVLGPNGAWPQQVFTSLPRCGFQGPDCSLAEVHALLGHSSGASLPLQPSARSPTHWEPLRGPPGLFGRILDRSFENAGRPLSVSVSQALSPCASLWSCRKGAQRLPHKPEQILKEYLLCAGHQAKGTKEG